MSDHAFSMIELSRMRRTSDWINARCARLLPRKGTLEETRLGLGEGSLGMPGADNTSTA
jgi:hypothetical protein